MKFTFKKAISILLIASAMLALPSCSPSAKLKRMNEEKRAAELLRLVQATDDKRDSLTIEYTQSFTCYYETRNNFLEYITVPININTVATTVKSNMQSDAYESLTTSTVTLDRNDSEAPKVTETVEGYQNGKLFFSETQTTKNGRLSNRLYSPLSVSEYRAYEKQIDLLFNLDFDPDAAANRTCVQTDEKGWIATYSGFSATALQAFRAMSCNAEDLIGDKFVWSDVAVTLRTDRDFRLESVEWSFVFEKTMVAANDAKQQIPTLTASATVKNVNATSQASAIDLTGWTAVENLTGVRIVEQALAKQANLASGAFSIDLYTQSNYMSIVQKSNAVISGVYQNENGKYTYNYLYDTTGSDYRYTYENGKEKKQLQMLQGGLLNVGKTSYTSAQAKENIKTWLNVTGFAPIHVLSARVTDAENGVYEIEVRCPDSFADSTLAEVENSTFKHVTGKLTVTVKDGVLTEYRAVIAVTVDLKGYDHVETRTYTVTYPAPETIA